MTRGKNMEAPMSQEDINAALLKEAYQSGTTTGLTVSENR
jgi:hypothetical protein